LNLTSQLGYAICTSPRSGSNFLGQLLESTEMLGRPLEYFNGAGRRALGMDGYPDDPILQLQKILTAGSTGNGVYALKIFAYQFDIARESQWTRRLPNLAFVHLLRRDILGQALSWARARQTRQFRSTQAPRGRAQFDGELIRACLTDVVREQARWAQYFAETGVPALTLYYEDVLKDPSVAVAAVAAHIGVDAPPPRLERLDVAIQRDDESDRWRARFLAEKEISEFRSL
jgi:LPS sulfotransferase NodH